MKGLSVFPIFSVLLIVLSLFVSCRSKSGNYVGSEVVIRDSSMNMSEVNDVEMLGDTLVDKAFFAKVSYFKNDNNGGFEQYELNMNLYEPDIYDGQESLCYGTLILYVKSPDSTEGIEISRRVITDVRQIENNEARLLMDNGAEIPISFEATLSYDSLAHTYRLVMNTTASQLDDLMENEMILQ